MTIPRRRFLQLAASIAVIPTGSKGHNLIAAETEKWGKVVKFSGAKAS